MYVSTVTLITAATSSNVSNAVCALIKDHECST